MKNKIKMATPKKHILISFDKLPEELQEAVRNAYPQGFEDAMRRIDKPNGDFIFVVPFETEEVSYMVKIEVAIDTEGLDDSDLMDDDVDDSGDIAGADDVADDSGDDE